MSVVTLWAQEAFGDVAGALAEAIPECLMRAHERG